MTQAYVIADVHATDPVKMAEYRVWSTKAMQEFGARVLVRGGAFEVLEGSWTPQRLVVLEFDSIDRARAFYQSETYATAKRIREGAGEMRMVLVEGV